MTSVYKALIWLKMCSKRLLKKRSFIILMCLIPIIVPIAQTAMKGDSGIVKIAVSSEDASEASEAAIKYLSESNSILQFYECSSPENAVEMVRKYKVDAAWIYKDNLEKRVSEFVTKESDTPFVRIVEREDSILLKLSREMLYGSVFNEVSFSIYKNHALENLKTKGVSEADFRKIFDEMERGQEIIQFSRLTSDAPIEKKSYLTGPTRGILSILVLFSALAAAMYFLKDQSEGKYDWLSHKKRILPVFAMCFSAAVFEGTAVMVALFVSSIASNVYRELLSMLLFIFSVTLFAVNISLIFRSYGKLGATLPGIIIIALILSPIFFNVAFLRPIRLLLPTHYYLYSIYDSSYYLYFILYLCCSLGIALLLNRIPNRKSASKKLI